MHDPRMLHGGADQVFTRYAMGVCPAGRAIAAGDGVWFHLRVSDRGREERFENIGRDGGRVLRNNATGATTWCVSAGMSVAGNMLSWAMYRLRLMRTAKQ